MEKIKVVIADDCSDVRKKISEALRRKDIDVVGEVSNGEQCLEIISKCEVDVIVSDLVMPVMDGMDMLEALRDRAKKPKVIIYSDVVTDYFISKTISLGAYYFLSKTASVQSLIKRIEDAYNQDKQLKSKPSAHYADEIIRHNVRPLEERIANIFVSVGIPAHIKGYQYLRDAIMLSVKDPNMINGITKRLYPSLAEKFQTSPPRVERAIRHAIEVAWTRGRVENINRLFGFKVYFDNNRPTNGEFIALVADKLILETKMAS